MILSACQAKKLHPVCEVTVSAALRPEVISSSARRSC